MDLGLRGRKALVTGGSRGIGLAVARQLAAEGCDLALCARSAGPLRAVAAQLEDAYGVKVHAEPVDVRDATAFEQWFADAVGGLGGLDVLVSNVSAQLQGSGEQWWRDTFDNDLLQHVRLFELALPHLRSGTSASVVFIASIAASLSQLPPTEFAYGSLKAALVNHAAQLSVRHGREGIRINCVSPGPVLAEGGVWEQIRSAMPEMYARVEQMSSLGRLGSAEDIARTVAFLASPAAAYTTGANVRVDGGTLKSVNF
jgi:NAD(P)-dependent dehydrogenase (short-subunit alcohol dehydrogenase family)